MQFHAVTVHTLPFFCLIALMLVNKSRLNLKDIKSIIITQSGYSFYNFIVVKIMGEPLYTILLWEDYKSVINSLLIIALSVLIFIIMTYLESCIKKGQNLKV